MIPVDLKFIIGEFTIISYIFMKGDQIFDNPFVAFDNSAHSLMVLDIIDSMGSAIPKITILHVHNPKKNYLPERAKSTAIYKYLKERYPTSGDPLATIDIK
jgi:uncharacterized protein YcgI (DUF1989 family)